MMFVTFLILAWILNLFGFGDIFIHGFKELFNKDITIYTYYFIFFLVGLIFDILTFLKRG